MGYNGNILPILASLTCFSLVLQLLYWAKLFEKLSMYSSVLENSITKTGSFFMLFFVIIFAFAMGMLSLDNILY